MRRTWQRSTTRLRSSHNLPSPERVDPYICEFSLIDWTINCLIEPSKNDMCEILQANMTTKSPRMFTFCYNFIFPYQTSWSKWVAQGKLSFLEPITVVDFMVPMNVTIVLGAHMGAKMLNNLHKRCNKFYVSWAREQFICGYHSISGRNSFY